MREKSLRQVFSLFIRYIVVTNVKPTRWQCIGNVRIEHASIVCGSYGHRWVLREKRSRLYYYEERSRTLAIRSCVLRISPNEKILGVRLSSPVELFGRLGDVCWGEKLGEQRRNDNRTLPQIPSSHSFGHCQRRRRWRLVAASGNRRPVLIIRAETAKSMSARWNRRRSAG